MPDHLISIALCTYNGSKYLRGQLDSIINQTYTNIELVVVDDCSTDDTYAIIKEYAALDTRIKGYQNETNLGFNKNFEKALMLTTAQYIAISDQDDIWELHKLQVLKDNIGNNWLIFSNSAYIDHHNNLTGKYLLQQFEGITNSPKLFMSFILRNFVTGHTTLLCREFIDYILPFPNEGYYDWWMGFVAAYHQKVTYVDAVLTKYRLHPESVVQQNINVDDNKFVVKKHLISIHVAQLNAMLGYKNLNESDRKIINQLKRALSLKMTDLYSLPIISLVNAYYNELFPDMKPRKGLSRWNFAIKYARGKISSK
jgi:glycosyltransferase involved in cell wall biosynthesis